MRMTLKRVTAWMLTLMMIFSCVPASAVDGSVVDFSSSTSAYDVMPLSNGATEPTASENITVTLVINNPNYTSDPGSGNTHLKAPVEIAGGELAYDLLDTGDYYLVTGTGKVCSFTIPKGTSLESNGYSMPVLKPTDYGSNNTKSYTSLVSWVTADNMVCSANTVFTENTTLYLQLYETNESRCVTFVCGCMWNHGVAASSTYFKLGQGLPQESIDAATAEANTFSSKWCQRGPASGERLAKWQLKVTATGEMVDLVAGMPITDAYIEDNTIRAYAVWETAGIPFNATFQRIVTAGDGTQTMETIATRSVYSGDALGELPTVEIPEGSTFVGWQYTDSDGSVKYATADTVITADTVFTAVFSMPVIATFQYSKTVDGEQTLVTLETRPLTAGAALGTLPTPEIPEGSTFVGWQYGTDAEGNPLYATADMTITENMTFTAVFGMLVTATFRIAYLDEDDVWSYEEIETRELTSRTALGALPDMSEADPLFDLFYRWVYTDDNGVEQTATAETVIAKDTVITAMPVELGNVVFYDVLPDGKLGNNIVEKQMPVGMTLAQALEYCEDSFEDETLLNECIWRTAINGEKADLENTLVSAENPISLYTHTYQIVLTLTREQPAAFNARASVVPQVGEDGTITMTITAREGEKLTAANFVMEDGTDLTDYAWTDANGQTIDLQKLIDEGVTESITAANVRTPALTLTLTLDGEKITKTITQPAGYILTAADFVVDGLDLTDFKWADENGNELALASLIGTELAEDRALTSNGTLNTSLSSNNRTVRFYVFVNGKRELVTERTETTYLIGERYYIPDSTLISVYRKYGYSGLSESVCYFPHAVDREDTIWKADTVVNDGLYFSPALTADRGTQTVDIYYLPTANLQGSGHYSNYISTNTFYTVNVEDAAGLVYTEGELPDTVYALVETSPEVTVKAPEGVEWVCEAQDPNVINSIVEKIDNGDGTVTFKIKYIREPYIIKTKGGVKVVYDLGTLPQTPEDTEYGTPKINGQSTYSEGMTTAEAAVYVPLAPNPASYFYKSGKYLGEVTFTGWVVNGDATKVIQPGVQVNLNQYNTDTVTLTAQWETHMGGTIGGPRQSSMVNFFVSYNAISEGSSAWLGKTKTNDFTPSVYTMDCGVIGQELIDHLMEYTHEIAGEDQQYAVIGDTSGGNLNDAHDEIVDNLTAGYTLTGSDGEDYTFTGTFPTDEHVLRTIRQMMDANPNMSIKINGRDIAASELTTRNFTVKWYVFKLASTNETYFQDDGWHIDGILVAKKGKMIVTKTFAGDEAAISAIRSNYTIDVTATGNEDAAVNASTQLAPNGADSYDGYNTFTWEVDVDQYFDYTLTENNYIFDKNATVSKAQYRVRNSDDPNQNTSGWVSYSSSGVDVTGRGYNETDSNDILRVDFLNTYTAPGTVVVQKIDAMTGNLMPNVSFEIGGTHASGAALQLYHLADSHYTVTPPNSYGTLTDTITTDSSGQAYLWIGGGSYWLKEAVPTGYDDPGKISIELEGESATSYKVVAITSASAANDTADKSFVSVGGSGELTLNVKNYSRTIDLKVTKKWLNKENKPVTIQLYRDGKALGSAYTVTLDGTVDSKENAPWSCTFADMPLYADGGLAQYSIREEQIGSMKYSDAFQTGYLYYDVDYSAMQYLDENDEPTTVMTEVETIALEVSNDRNHGSLAVGKVDENNVALEGAVFYLYEAPAGSAAAPTVTKESDGHNVLTGYRKVDEATSAPNGSVDFGNVNAGRYYLVEHSAPEGYIGSDQVYLIQFDGSNAVMQYYAKNADGTSAWTTMASRVTNRSETVNIPVTKIWEDAENTGKRPTSISVTLTGMVGDKVVVTRSVRITTENSDVNMGDDGNAVPSSVWSHTFEKLPQYSGGEKITYTLTEAPVAGYESSIVDPNPNDEEVEFTITNTLLSNITYTVSKLVDGNFADRNKMFAFTAVVRNSAGEAIKTETFSLKHGGSYAIVGIPYGATVEVTENPDGYEASYQLGQTVSKGNSYTTGAILDSSQSVTFINTKNVTIDTGVDLDGLPYTMMLLSMAGLGVALLLARRRRNEA